MSHGKLGGVSWRISCVNRGFETLRQVFDGNSLLLKKSKNQYIFVGGNIFSFESEAEISRYSSPVGNSDVPYPFAVDTEGRNYLLINNVVLNTVPEGKDPYEHFYFSVRCQKILGCPRRNDLLSFLF